MIDKTPQLIDEFSLRIQIELFSFFLLLLLVNIDYLCSMEEKTGDKANIRKIYRTSEFDDFYSSLPSKVKDKFEYVFLVVQTVYNVSTKFVKHIENTELYELRVAVGSNEYRTVLFAIDPDNVIESSRIILLNGFLKKSSKDYKKQIEKARTILKNLQQ